MSGLTGVAELDVMIKVLNKKFKQEIITNEVFEFRGSLSTTSLALDAALGVGGILRARINELSGVPGSAKTSMGLICIAEAQKERQEDKDRWENERDLVIDLEHTITGEFMRGFGIDTSRVIHVRPTTAEEALAIATELPKTDMIDIVLYDSIAAGQSMKQIERDYGEVDVGGISKLMHNACRQISKICEKHSTTYIFINQLTSNPGAYGSPVTSPGGQAIPFYASCRLRFMKPKPSPTHKGAMQMRVRIIKNKAAPPYGNDPVPINFFYGKGVDPVDEALEALRVQGVLRHSGGVTKVRWPDTEEMALIHEDCPKGKDACYAFVRENPEFLEKLRSYARDLIS